MPGNSEKRSGYVRVTRPPNYVNVPTQVAYAPVPDALVVTMIRILGLCWTNRYRHTPPLTLEQLARHLDRPRSTLQRHLDLLERELGWLRRERQDGRFILHPCPPYSVHSTPEDLEPSPSASVAGELPVEGRECARSASVAVGSDTVENCSSAPAELPGTRRSRVHVADETPDNGQDSPYCRTVYSEIGGGCSFADAKLPGTGLDPVHDTQRASRDRPRPVSETLAARQDLIQALAEVGIENPARERIALDPAVKADWIPAWQLWAEHPARANLSNLPGYIVSCLKHRDRPPEHYLRLVRLTPAEDAQLRRSYWEGDRDLDPDLRVIRPLYIQHFMERG